MLPKISIDASQKWMGSFKVIQEESIQKERRKLYKGSIQKLKTKKIFPFKSDRFEKYRMRRRRFKRSPYRLIDRDAKFEEYSPHFKVKQMTKLNKLSSKNDVTSVTKFANFLRKLITIQKEEQQESKPLEIDRKWPATYAALEKLKHEMDRTKQLPGSKPYKFRMYDIVLENEEPTFSPSENKSPAGLIRQGLQMVNSMIGKEHAGRRKMANTKWLSPRFMPLMPDKMEGENEVLSPTIFSFYKNNKTIAALPDVLDTFGMADHDRDSVLGMLMDVTGTTKHVNTGIELLKELNFFEIKEDILNSNEHIITNFVKLENSLNWNQQKNLDKNGFTILSHHQMDKFYRDQGVQNEIDLTRFECLKNYTKKQTEHSLWLAIENIAQNLTFPLHKRQKRFFLTEPDDVEFARETGGVDVLRPILLAPFAFSPTFGFAVIGPIILSPFIFSPFLINPTLLSPIILSPALAIPEIMSPYLLGPFILSPFVMQPGILTPYALSPNILNPFILSPIILSPILLSPDILSPQILGGGVLSPTFASPSVFTETAFMISALSPSFLS
uniref:Uncharacterized protein n=1 Tax=Acrobeloides nanus TaxID=290746 RepID=A0A914CF76_9BILA